MVLLSLLTSLLSVGSSVIDGYNEQLSVKPGDSLTIFLNGNKNDDNYELRLYDLESNEVAKYNISLKTQAAPGPKSWERGFGYLPSARVKIPQLKSGVYLWEGKIPLVVKATKPKVIVLYSSNTENAYSASGGKSLYGFNSSDLRAANKVSFLRPIALPKHSEEFLRWMYRQSLDNVGYITDIDMDDYNEIKNASLLIIPGHSEYWTLQARKNFDRFVSEGKDALVLSGNTMWWQVRYEANNTQLVCHRTANEDPIRDPLLKTINWNEHELKYPILQSIGVDFSLAGFGLKHPDKGWDGFKIVNEKSPLLVGSNLKSGDIIKLPSDEYDGTLVSGFIGLGKPIPNKAALGFEKIEIVAYDSSFRLGSDLMATWIVFKKSKKSGIVINTASTDWCSFRGMRNPLIQLITLNMIQKLLRKEDVFSPDNDRPSLVN